MQERGAPVSDVPGWNATRIPEGAEVLIFAVDSIAHTLSIAI